MKTETETETQTETENKTAELLRRSLGLVDDAELRSTIRTWAFATFARGPQAAEDEGVPPVFSESLLDGFDAARELGIEVLQGDPKMAHIVDGLKALGAIMKGGQRDGE